MNLMRGLRCGRNNSYSCTLNRMKMKHLFHTVKQKIKTNSILLSLLLPLIIPYRFLCRAYNFPVSMYGNLRIPVWLIQGESKNTEHNLSLLYGGSAFNKKYLTGLIFNETVTEIYLGKTWIWNIKNLCKTKNIQCPLILLETTQFLHRWTGGKKTFVIPEWILGVIDISPSVEKILRRSRSLRRSVDKIKKHGLDFEITRDKEKFDLFYHTMYTQYVPGKFSGNHIAWEYTGISDDELKNHELLLIKKNQNYLAGMVIFTNPENNYPLLLELGVSEGSKEYVKDGVLHAAYYYAICHLKNKGYTEAGIGLTRAFLNDGVLQYKRKWGIKIKKLSKYNKLFVLSILDFNPGVENFLLSNPFIHITQNSFKGAVFVKDEIECLRSIRYILNNHKINGLSELQIIMFDTSNKTSLEKTLSRYSAHVTVRSFHELL